MKKVIPLILVALMVTTLLSVHDEIAELRQELNTLKTEVTELLSDSSNSGEIAELLKEISALRSEVAELRQEINALKSEVTELKEQVTAPTSELAETSTKMAEPTPIETEETAPDEAPVDSDLLDMSKTAEVQIAIVNSGTYEGKEAVLTSSELTAEALVALCKKPECFNLDSDLVQSWFQSALERTKLTSEQEVEIANTGEYAIQRALLLRTNLTAEGLIALCKKPEAFNLDSNIVQSWFRSALERTTLTSEQEVEIANTGVYAIQRALLLRTNLTAEGLIALCKKPEAFNLNSDLVKNWFKKASERITFTKEQELELAKTGIGEVQKELMK